MEPTREQAIIIQAATETNDNLLIRALAGAAKTTTLVLIAEALPNVRILCLAFNKRIADEMTRRLPKNCTAMTLNSLGMRTWSECSPKRPRVDTSKVYRITSDLIKTLPREQQSEAFKSFVDLMKMVEFGKACGFIPNGVKGNGLMADDEFYEHLDEEVSPLIRNLCTAITTKSIEEAHNGIIDFGDQIFMPTLYPAMFSQYDLVLVDEAQDLSALNHAMLRKLVKKRIIAVGDECQSIYGFRGAHQDSMNLLRESFSMRELQLSISFRCPIAVVEEARWRAPHMAYPDWAAQGDVVFLRVWAENTIPASAAILCRNNAPLFSCAIKLLKAGRYPKLVGNDIGKYLLKIMSKFGDSSMLQKEVLAAISRWEDSKLAKSRNHDKVYDQGACMRIFAEQGPNLGDALAYAEYLFASQGPIELMTIHKAKGLEFDHVFILDRELIRAEEAQDANVLYVAQTRAKETLTYINLRDYVA